MSVRAGFRRVRRRLVVTAAAVALTAGAMAGVGVTVGAALNGRRRLAQEAVRHLRRGRARCVRGRAQHHPGAVRRLRRRALPGAPRVRQHDRQHLAAERRGGARPATPPRRTRSARARRCVITEIYDQSGNGNNLTDAPGRRRIAGEPGRPRQRHRRTPLGRAATGLRRVHRRGRRLPRRQHQEHRHRQQLRGRVRRPRRHPLQRRLLLRLRQRRDHQQRRRRRHHGGHLLRQHQGLGLRHRQWPLDHGRHGERPVLRRPPPATTPTTPPPATGTPPP